MKNNERRDYAVTFIANDMTTKQAARYFEKLVEIKQEVAPKGRGTIRTEEYDHINTARHKKYLK